MSERNKIRLGIIFGGKSGEHEVSLMVGGVRNPRR